MRDVHFPCSGLFSILCSASIYNYGARARAHTLRSAAWRVRPRATPWSVVSRTHTRAVKKHILCL